jgi:hypothetical protein
MNLKNTLLGGILGIALVYGGTALAQKPVRDISAARHPNLAAAQRFTDQAFNKIVAAQAANEWDLDGHAAKAKELLDQANQELKLAAEASNRNHK